MSIVLGLLDTPSYYFDSNAVYEETDVAYILFVRFVYLIHAVIQ